MQRSLKALLSVLLLSIWEETVVQDGVNRVISGQLTINASTSDSR